MDDLILGLLALMFAAMVVTLALAIATAVLAATMLATTAWAFTEGLAAFTVDFRGSVARRGGTRRVPRAPEPAFELYVLHQVFADFRHAAERAAAALGKARQRFGGFAAKYSEGPTLPVSIGAVLGGYVGTAVAGILGILSGLVVGAVVVVVGAISWLLIWLLRAADAVRRRVRHASYECPTDHERFPLPVYICPACGAEHARLVPGRWGVFKRECQCGQTALPTTVLAGRQRVPQRCPSGHSMSGFLGYAENLPIAIVGGPSAGKSTFLAAALLALDAPDAGVFLEPLSESRDAYARLVDAMRAGVTPDKTVDQRRPALVAEVQGSGRSRALYAYDLAGEVYASEDKLRGLRFLARSAGIVMLIDPFSIRRVAEDRAAELAPQAERVLPSSEDPMRVYERLLATLKEAGANTHEMPLAILLAKSDALGVEQEVQALARTAGEDRAVKIWLENNGAGNLVRAIEQEFKQIGWFSVSALGRMPDPSDTTPFTPRGALQPLLWILACRHVKPSQDPTAVTRTAQRLLATAADFPPPSARARSRNTIAALAAFAALVAAPAIVLSAGGPSSETFAASHSSPSETGAPSPYAPNNPDTPASPQTPAAKHHHHAHPSAPAPVVALRHHLEALDHGNYTRAFALMAAAYRSKNPSWPTDRQTADPMINIVDLAAPSYRHRTAYIFVRFYARDRHPSPGSDTKCRRFEGVAQLAREGKAWRYDPNGNDYTVTVEPADDPNCHP